MKLFFLLCLLGLVLADEIEIIDCGSKVEILSITFDGCSGFPCVIHKGETATGQVTMVARSTTDSLTCKVYHTLCRLQAVYQLISFLLVFHLT